MVCLISQIFTATNLQKKKSRKNSRADTIEKTQNNSQNTGEKNGIHQRFTVREN